MGFKRIIPFDIQVVDGKETLYYLKWITGAGFIQVSKEVYERSLSKKVNYEGIILK